MVNRVTYTPPHANKMFKHTTKQPKAFSEEASMGDVRLFNSALMTKNNDIYLNWIKQCYHALVTKCGGKPFIPTEDLRIGFEQKLKRYCDARVIWNSKTEGRVKWLREEIVRVSKLLGKHKPKL